MGRRGEGGSLDRAHASCHLSLIDASRVPICPHVASSPQFIDMNITRKDMTQPVHKIYSPVPVCVKKFGNALVDCSYGLTLHAVRE
ncbi:MAG: hypothetical protein DI540_25375 [Sphingobium sp.]|nr:MAG: hypothetical protein DI540_25375 [Sphingobium sp.]